jgi:hypothetical protein
MPDTPEEKPNEPTPESVKPAEPIVVTPPPELPKRKTADRPHNLTIMLGLLSPMLALLALYMSIQSIKVSRQSLEVGQRSMEIGQRAYIHAELTINSPKQSKDAFVFTFTFRNQGNTPGSINKVEVSATEGPDSCTGNVEDIYRRHMAQLSKGSDNSTDVTPCPDTKPLTQDFITSIASKETATDAFMAFPVATSALDKTTVYGLPLPDIHGTVTYDDVFHKTHHSEIVCYVYLYHKHMIPNCYTSGD